MSKNILKKFGITKKQAKLLNEMASTGDVDKVLKENKIHISKYLYWLLDQSFRDYCQLCMDYSFLKAKFIISSYAVASALILVGLLDSDKPETVRKACLDILKGPVLYKREDVEKTSNTNKVNSKTKISFGNQVLDDNTASEILATLAENTHN